MKAADLRTKLEEYRAQTAKLVDGMTRGEESSMTAAINGSIVVQSLFLGEIALQLADLNEKLTPASIVAGILEIQKTLDEAKS